MNTFVISSILIVLAGFMANSYKGYAMKYGWPFGAIWFEKEKLIAILVFCAIIPGIIQLIYETGLIKGILISLGLFIAAPLVMVVFKTWSQYLIYLLVLISAIIWIAGGIEVVHN